MLYFTLMFYLTIPIKCQILDQGCDPYTVYYILSVVMNMTYFIIICFKIGLHYRGRGAFHSSSYSTAYACMDARGGSWPG